MANGSFIVHGSKPLSGSIVANGNKNEALPVLAACLLTSETVSLHNVPLIGDIKVMSYESYHALAKENRGKEGKPDIFSIMQSELEGKLWEAPKEEE